jgi:hypothetical protein
MIDPFPAEYSSVLPDHGSLERSNLASAALTVPPMLKQVPVLL